MILTSPHVPLTRRTLVDEDQLLDQLDLIRINLPDAFEKALEIIAQKEEILLEAEEYGQQLIVEAERVAAQMLNETGIIQEAEREAYQIRQRVQQECAEMRQSTLEEIEEMREQSLQQLEQLRKAALAECEDIQNGADDYADSVLTNIEQQLTDMLRVIRNGRQQLETDAQTQSYSRENRT